MIGRQTWAIFVDSYRELNAKKLFWITMILSVLIVAVFAMIGIDEEGIRVLWMLIPGTDEFAQRIKPEIFYQFLMQAVGIGMWLTWVATILALVSTATIFPDLVQSGSIDLMLSKPISRWRLFLTKYLCGLLFVALQVTIFSVGSFLVVGIRGGAWEFGLFLAIPIVVVFFSYLFSVCALLGILTRSAIASVMLTILLWIGLWGFNTTEAVLLDIQARRQYEQEFYAQRLGLFEKRVESLRAEIAEEEAAGREPSARDLGRIEYGEAQIEDAQESIDSARDSLPGIERWAGRITGVRAVFPKTNETIELLSRYLLDFEELAAFFPEQRAVLSDEDLEKSGAQSGSGPGEIKSQQQRLNEFYSSRSLWWVIGTSLGFEVVMLAIAGFIFSRRDF